MLANPSFHSRPPFLRYKGRRLSFSSFPPLYLRSRQPPLPSLCLLLSTSGKKFGVRALSESEVSESTITGDGGQYIPEPYSVKIPVGDRHGDSSSVGNLHRRRSSLESLFCYDKAIPEEIIEKPIGLSLAEKVIGNNPRCTDCQAKGAILCATCSGSGLYVDSILESQGIIVKVRCIGCGGIGNIMCSECGGRGHL